jgi:hypothetical protein
MTPSGGPRVGQVVRAVNGTRGGPPDRPAENWSRRDGIRAGAVSGPWRSGPRADAPATARAWGDRPRPDPNRHPVPSPAWPTTAAADGDPAPPAPIPAPVPPPETPRRGVRIAGWLAFAAVLAVGVAVAAGLLRMEIPTLLAGAPAFLPETTAEAPAQVAEVTPAPAAATGEAAKPAIDGHVRLRIGEDFPRERQAEIVAALEEAGLAPVKIEALPFRVATSRVGYYRPEDEAAAGALAELIQPVVGPAAGAVGTRDYAELLSDAEPGRLDLWIGN